jgi:hypothetical protein
MQWKLFSLIFVMALLTALVGGCATPTPLTTNQKECVSRCETEYFDCTSKCLEDFESKYTDPETCRQQCMENKIECEQLCENSQQ